MKFSKEYREGIEDRAIERYRQKWTGERRRDRFDLAREVERMMMEHCRLMRVLNRIAD